MARPFIVAALLCASLLGGLHSVTAAPRQQTQATHTISINVIERAWIEVTVDGEQRYRGIMTTGTQESWTGQSIVLLIGNAGGVEVTADGEFLGVLGAVRQVVTLRWPEQAGRYPPADPATATPPSPTLVPSPTLSPTPSPTPSPTASPTPTTQPPTSTPTASATPTATESVTSTRRATATARATRTREATATATATVAVTAAHALTVTGDVTATIAETSTATTTLSVTSAITAMATVTTTQIPTDTLGREPTVHVVQPGDTLGDISVQYNVDAETLIAVNNIANPDVLGVDWQLLIPGSDGTLPDVPTPIAPLSSAPGIQARGTITERMTSFAREMAPDSPYYGKTWLTYYGRPNVPIMGILGEYDVDELARRLAVQAAAYDEANGPALDVMPAFHLVYGMATKGEGWDGSYLGFMTDEEVMTYISKAIELDYGVILDVQIGALSPARAISNALAYLKYENVHLAIDPEFAMVHRGQLWPGDPIGYVTAEQVNETQAVIQQYMEENGLSGPRILLVHQFQYNMIHDKEDLDYSYDRVALTLSVDGWGGPWGKISKYNTLVDENSPFTAFKLFYQWDEPLMDERQALGEDAYPEIGYMEITPNLIIYQ